MTKDSINNLNYSVCIWLAIHSPIRVKGYFVRLLTYVPGLTIEELEGNDGLYHYSTEAFRGLPEANAFLMLISKADGRIVL